MFLLLYLQNLRDEHGNLYSQDEYNLQQSADGRVHLLPRDRSANNNPMIDPRNVTQHHQHMQQQQHPQHPHQHPPNHPHSHHHHHHNGHHPHHQQH